MENEDSNNKIREFEAGGGVNAIGYDNIPVQKMNKANQRGYEFNILCIGESGIGKTTLIDSLFNISGQTPTTVDNTPEPRYLNHTLSPSVSMASRMYDLCEKNIRLRLTVVETVGYGDQVNKENSFKPIVEHIDEQLESYFQEELKLERCFSTYRDTRIHACLYFIAPTGHGLKGIDILCLKSIDKKVNLIPVIAKADAFSKSELKTFKEQILSDLRENEINIYQAPDASSDDSNCEVPAAMNEEIPFAVVGSREFVQVGDSCVRARSYPWGIVKVENGKHCDFVRLREMLIRTHMADMIEETNTVHFEHYRKLRLQQIGFNDEDDEENLSLQNRYRQTMEKLQDEFTREEDHLKHKFIQRIREKEIELKSAESALRKKYERLKAKQNLDLQQLEDEKSKFSEETSEFRRLTEEFSQKGRKLSDTLHTFSLGSLGKKKKVSEENQNGSN